MFREIKQTCGPKGKSRSVYEIVFLFRNRFKTYQTNKRKNNLQYYFWDGYDIDLCTYVKCAKFEKFEKEMLTFQRHKVNIKTVELGSGSYTMISISIVFFSGMKLYFPEVRCSLSVSTLTF